MNRSIKYCFSYLYICNEMNHAAILNSIIAIRRLIHCITNI